jgi:hypothetical protein
MSAMDFMQGVHTPSGPGHCRTLELDRLHFMQRRILARNTCLKKHLNVPALRPPE